jgi:DNA-binding MarR family transcriptional regulator
MPKPGTYSRKSLSSKEWHKELLLSWLFQTCFKLQASLDRRFLSFGMTFQEAAVLMRCVEAGEIVPSRLALILSRDKGKITRFVDRLEAAELVKRLVKPRDRRYSVIRPTPKGKRLADRIASTFEQIRRDLFAGVLDRDIQRLGSTLPRLHTNAALISSKRRGSGLRRARRIGENNDHLQKVETRQLGKTSPPMNSSDGRTVRHNGVDLERSNEHSVRTGCKNPTSEPEEVRTSVSELVTTQ